MSQGYPRRVNPLFIAVFLAIMLGVTLCRESQAKDAVVGFKDAQGAFVPVCRLSKQGSDIRFQKLKPADKFEAMHIKFVFPNVGRPGAMEGVRIQWEKASGDMGKLVPVQDHAWFDSRTKTLRGEWKRSPSFRIVDSSGRGIFRTLPWNKIMAVTIDGRPLIGRQPGVGSGTQAKKPAAARKEPSQAAVRPARRPSSVALEVRRRAARLERSALIQKRLESEYRELGERIVALERIVSDISLQVKSVRTWLFWGPVLCFGLSMLFMCVTIFLVFSKLSPIRGMRSRIPGRPPRAKF